MTYTEDKRAQKYFLDAIKVLEEHRDWSKLLTALNMAIEALKYGG